MKEKIILSWIVGCMAFFSCSDNLTPKPFGYFRIEVPEKPYPVYDENPYFLFSYSGNAKIENIPDSITDAWFNITYPVLKAKIYCSYLPFRSKQGFRDALEDSYKFVYSHSLKANDITEEIYANPEERVFGMIYYVSGNVASPMQFILTDSTRHFFRGALYFETEPNQDSITPVLNFINKDIDTLIHTFHWK